MGDESVVGAIEPALRQIAVLDRGPGDLARQPQGERLVDRRRDRFRAHPPVPGAQALDRRQLALISRPQPGQPASRLQARKREHVRLHRLEALQIVLGLRGDQLLDPARPVAVQVVAGDVVRDSPRGRSGCWP